MAQYFINRNVAGAQELSVEAAGYAVREDFIHFLDERERKVLSIRKDITFLVERAGD
ncbi:hypothetical protein [Streptomyces sp. CS081A]|uniref:hypothetical protein n=1 Tax=Streptomyces TaxID=1883 RepID=UPI0013A5B96E|nr:hypothetical protein [Streptomyces sp. CS081A]